jgi:hypothetical protein
MMACMENLERMPTITRADVRALVKDVGDGTFRASDLYERYCEMVKADGRSPVRKEALGVALRAAGQRSKNVVIKSQNIRAWVIRERFLVWLTNEED